MVAVHAVAMIDPQTSCPPPAPACDLVDHQMNQALSPRFQPFHRHPAVINPGMMTGTAWCARNHTV